MAKTKMKVLKNNRLVPAKDCDFLTLAAEKIVEDSVRGMVEKLSRLNNVEYFPGDEDLDDDPATGFPLNTDTAFREQLAELVEEKLMKYLYKLT